MLCLCPGTKDGRQRQVVLGPKIIYNIHNIYKHMKHTETPNYIGKQNEKVRLSDATRRSAKGIVNISNFRSINGESCISYVNYSVFFKISRAAAILENSAEKPCGRLCGGAVTLCQQVYLKSSLTENNKTPK